MILMSMLTNAQAFKEISCETYISQRAYFGTSQRPVVIKNQTDRWINLTYKNAEQKEFEILKVLAPGASKTAYTFNNAMLAIKDVRSGACLQALQLNPDNASDITIEVSGGKVLQEIRQRDPATGESILKIDCNFIQEEFTTLYGSAALNLSNKTNDPVAIHRLTSKVGKVGEPLLIIPPSGLQNLFYAIGGRFMIKDKMGQCVGVYEVLGDATLSIDKKELAKPGLAPFAWETNVPDSPVTQVPTSFRDVVLVTSQRTTQSSENALKLAGKGDYLLTDIKNIPSEFTMEFVFKASEVRSQSPLQYLIYKAGDLQNKNKQGEILAHIQDGGHGTIQLVVTISFMGSMPKNTTSVFDQFKGNDSNREQKIEKTNWGVSAIELDPDLYHHIAFVCTGDTMKLYHNGFLEQEEYLLGSTFQSDDNAPLIIGGSPKDDLESNAIIDEFRIWDRALNAKEIDAAKNHILTGSEHGLMHYLDFNLTKSQKNHSNRVVDRTTGEEIGSLVNFRFDERSNWIDAGPDDWKTQTMQIFSRETSGGYTLHLHEDRRVASLQIDDSQYNEILEETKQHIKNVPAYFFDKQVFEWMPNEYDFFIWYLNEQRSLDPNHGGICMRTNSKAHNIGFGRNDSPFHAGESRFMGNIVIDGGRLIVNSVHHEICHLWGVGNLFKTEVPLESVKIQGIIKNPEVEYNGHWGFTGSGAGALGGFRQNSLKELGDNWYQADLFHPRSGSPKFSNLELYLMGLLPSDSLNTFDLFRGITDFHVQEKKFRAEERITYTPDKLIELIGERSPSWDQSQKHFKGMNIIISPSPLTGKEWKLMNRDVEIEGRKEEIPGHGVSFWEATRGTGTLELDKLVFKDEN